MSASIDSHVKPGPRHVTELCDFCMELVQAMLSPDETQDWRILVQPICSACEFCEGLTERSTSAALRRNYAPETTGQLKLYCSKSVMQNDVNLLCGITIWHEYDLLNFAVWADEGTPACKRFTTRPPILGPNMEDTGIVARDLLDSCRLSHGGCVSTERSKLPTRVLQISSNVDSTIIRLIETKDLGVARYCALSHCWGPVDKQPLRTTCTSYPRRLHGITHDQLPKTFKDAILLTRALNIEYLWIDSLCIIQDNEEDWRLEAGKMGDVYRNATLVISASDAKDSTEGLFITERKHEIVMVVPYIAEGMVQGTFNIAYLPAGLSRPEKSHLNTRAWAFQERLLARRIMFFTREGISWKCSHFETWEHGIKSSMMFHENTSWLVMLREYSKKRLTNAGDRLYALQGVVEDMRDARGDHYYDSCGVWESDLYKQIIWRPNEPILETEVLDLPTWTWAATGGAKLWCLETKYCDSAGASLPRVIRISSSGALLSSGHISQGVLTLNCFKVSTFLVCAFQSNEWSLLFDEEFRPWFGKGLSAQIIGGTSAICGFAVFDRERFGTVKCFFVARQDRETGYAHDKESHQDTTLISRHTSDSACKSGVQISADEATALHSTLISASEQETDTHRAIGASDIATSDDNDSDERGSEEIDSYEVDSEGNYRDGFEREEECSVPADSDALSPEDQAIVEQIEYLSKNTDFVYWCLLLEPAGAGKYTRVGIAMLYSHAFEALGAVEEEFEII